VRGIFKRILRRKKPGERAPPPVFIVDCPVCKQQGRITKIQLDWKRCPVCGYELTAYFRTISRLQVIKTWLEEEFLEKIPEHDRERAEEIFDQWKKEIAGSIDLMDLGIKLILELIKYGLAVEPALSYIKKQLSARLKRYTEIRGNVRNALAFRIAIHALDEAQRCIEEFEQRDKTKDKTINELRRRIDELTIRLEEELRRRPAPPPAIPWWARSPG